MHNVHFSVAYCSELWISCTVSNHSKLLLVRSAFGRLLQRGNLNPSRIAATTVSKRERIRWGPSRQDGDTEHLVPAPMTQMSMGFRPTGRASSKRETVAVW